MRRSIFSLAVLISVGAFSPSAGQITLSQDFDSGSLDVPASSIVGDTIHLVGRRTWSAYPQSYRWVYFHADGVLGRTPQFRISSNSFLGSYELHKFVYSYDRQNWSFFENATIASGTYAFSSTSAFTHDRVYVAYGLPYPVARSLALTQQALQSPFARPTLSGGTTGVIGRSAAGVDDTGRAIAPMDLHAYRISDDGFVAPKRKVVLVAGNHSAETPGDFALEGFVRFLLSTDPRAAGLRRSAEFYVYPQVNPGGRFAGYYRSNPENPDKDFNRFWNNPAGFTDLSSVVASMRSDTGGNVDQLFDFHAWWGPWTENNFVFVVPSQASHPYLARLRAHEPAIGVIASVGDPGMLRVWSATAAGLGAKLAITPELGFFPNMGEDRLLQYGRSFALALYESIPIHVLPGDFDDDGVVNLSDFAILGTHFNRPVSGVSFGDANGDGFVDLADFSILSAYWMSGTGLVGVVPEPTGGITAIACAILLARRRKLRTVDRAPGAEPGASIPSPWWRPVREPPNRARQASEGIG